MKPEELMRFVAAAYEKGDTGPLMNAIHPDIVWKPATQVPGLFGFGGNYERRAGVLTLTSKIAVDYTFVRLEPREIIGKGDVVWGLFDAELEYRPRQKGQPAKSLKLEIAFHWRMRDEKVIEHQSFFDTAFLMAESGMPAA